MKKVIFQKSREAQGRQIKSKLVLEFAQSFPELLVYSQSMSPRTDRLKARSFSTKTTAEKTRKKENTIDLFCMPVAVRFALLLTVRISFRPPPPPPKSLGLRSEHGSERKLSRLSKKTWFSLRKRQAS